MSLVKLKLTDDSNDGEDLIVVIQKQLSLQIEDDYHPKSPQNSLRFDDID